MKNYTDMTRHIFLQTCKIILSLGINHSHCHYYFCADGIVLASIKYVKIQNSVTIEYC